MDQDAMKELWLNEHAIECPVYTARISLRQCSFLRSLPTEGTEINDDTRGGIGHRSTPAPKFRDIACDSCTAWKAKGANPEENTTRKSRERPSKKQ